MQSAELFAQVIDFLFGQILLVLRFAQLHAHIFQILQNLLEHLTNPFHMLTGIPQQ